MTLYLITIAVVAVAAAVAYQLAGLGQRPDGWRVAIAQVLGYHRCPATHPYIDERCARAEGHSGIHKISIWSWYDTPERIRL